MQIDQQAVRRIRYYSRVLDNIEAVRIAVGNREQKLRRDNIPLSEKYNNPLDALEQAEKEARKNLKLELRAFSPALAQWAKDTPGVGEEGLSRLIGVIGHPCYAFPSHFEDNPDFNPDEPSSEDNPKRILVEDEPFERSVSALWAYTGAGDPKKQRRRGESQEENMEAGNPDAKKRSWLLVRNAGLSKTGYLRSVYLERKEYYADRVDESGKPWTKGHIDNAARRFVRKQILKDIFNVAYQEALA